MSSTITDMNENAKAAPSISFSIPGCTATHVLDDTTIPLGQGTLMLIPSSEQQPVAHQTYLQSKKNRQPISYTLTIGPHVAFPLYPSTTFGALASDPRSYVFSPSLSTADPTNPTTSTGAEIDAGQTSYVRITLPPGVLDSDLTHHGVPSLSSVQESFERILADFGCLREGRFLNNGHDIDGKYGADNANASTITGNGTYFKSKFNPEADTEIETDVSLSNLDDLESEQMSRYGDNATKFTNDPEYVFISLTLSYIYQLTIDS